MLYILLSAVGSLVPDNVRWRETERGVTVFVRSNGIHTDIVMPARLGELDWLAVLPPGHVRAPGRQRGWVAVGAGEREFFLHTPSWADVRPTTVARAAWGGTVLLHVEHLGEPRAGPRVRPLTLRPDEYARLWRAVRGQFRPGADGRPVPLLGRGYGANDAFYLAIGRYDGWNTCNQWTGRMLRAAGVKVGRWTPLPRNLLWRFRDGGG